MGEYINSRQLRFDRSNISCGVLEAHHIPEDTEEARYSIANNLYHKANGRPAAFVIFSDKAGAKAPSRGEQLAEKLQEIIASNQIGTLTSSTVEVNPKTGSRIRVWLLTPDHEKFRDWYTEATMHQVRE